MLLQSKLPNRPICCEHSWLYCPPFHFRGPFVFRDLNGFRKGVFRDIKLLAT